MDKIKEPKEVDFCPFCGQNQEIAWVNVNDRLPNREDRILLVFVDEEIDCRRTIWFSHSQKKWMESRSIDYHEETKKKITHWMPLPKPPNIQPPVPDEYYDSLERKYK